MPRITEDEVVRLKRDVDLLALVRSSGVELKRTGKDYLGLCPFHNDKNPSLVVTPSKNLWNCLGACQKGGSVVDWVMKAHGVKSFRHAVEILKNGHLAMLPASTKGVEHSTVKKLPSPVDLSADENKLLKQVIDYYHQRLKESPQALKYLEKRGIKNASVIEEFKIGYSDRTLGLRLPDNNREAGRSIREKLTKIGIYRTTGHEHFSGSIVIPVMDLNGIVTEVYGRKIIDNLRPGTIYHTYLPGPHRGLFNPRSLISKEIILCESLIDALSFHSYGIRNVTTSYGIRGFSDENLKAFIDHRIQKVYIAYDNDEAGNLAADNLAKKLIGEGIECLRLEFPKKIDANKFVCQSKTPEVDLKQLINSAVWIGKGDRPSSPDRPLSPNVSSLAAEQKAPETEPEKNTKINIPTEHRGEDIEITLAERKYRIRGLGKNLSYDQLKVNIRVSVGEKYYIDTLDLYNARHRGLFIRSVSEEVDLEHDIIKRDVGRVLLKLEAIQDEMIKKTLSPEKKEVIIGDKDREEALAFLRDRKIFDRIARDFVKYGIVGENMNALVCYLASLTRRFDDPISIIIQSSSSAGKSSLMDAALAFVPDEEKCKYTAMTGQSIFYMGENDLSHKTLAISEEEGLEKAYYAIKNMQSDNEVTIAVPVKDVESGVFKTQGYHVLGPIQVFITSTNIFIYDEFLNRCIVLTINENREQTRLIHRMQRDRETLEGVKVGRERESIVRLHQNAQRLLRPLLVVNPYARYLTFSDTKLRTRRDQKKYLTLIRAVAYLRQYQREVKTTVIDGKETPYIEVTLDDIEVANRLANVVLGRSLDELAPQTRAFLNLNKKMVDEECRRQKIEQSECRYTRKQIREYTGWSDNQVKVHMKRLEDLEYVVIHRRSHGVGFEYELLYCGEGSNGKPFLLGLIDPEALRKRLGI